MVRVGNHTLQIVDAQTLQPLQEYAHHNREIWVEGRPGHEFWLRLISHGRGTRTVASTIEVDGNNIGYRFNHGPDCNLEANLGPIGASSLLDTPETGDNTKSCQAFSFARRALPQGISNGASATATGGKPSSSSSKSSNHGSVQVTWSEGYESGIPTRKWFRMWNETSLEQRRQQQSLQHYSSQEPSTTAAPSPDKKEGVGCLQSKLGTSTHRVPKASTSWNLGRPLCTITIRYCEMAGLVARGIVQLPLQVQGQMVVAGDGNKKRKARTVVETVDLTCDSDNDGEVNGKQREISKTSLTAPLDLSSATDDYHDEANNDAASEATLKEATNATGAVDLTTSDNEEETALSGTESRPEATNNTENKE